ncbi:hypothetical protein CHUAL_006701 [Chamberlinius hualienensis]
MIFFASIVLITTYIQFVVSQQSPTCDGGIYDNIIDFLNGGNYCNFPYYKITSDIVRDSCPQLTTQSLCPFNADKSLNKVNIEDTIIYVKNCLQQPAFGDIQMNPIMFTSVTCIVDEMLKGTGVTGECYIPPNINFIYNVNDTLITVTGVQDTVNISIDSPNLLYQGAIDCKFKLPLVDIPITMNNVSYSGKLSLDSKSSISLNNNNSVPEIQSPTATFEVNFNFLNLPILNNIPIGKLFSKFFQQIINQTKISEIFGKFIAAIVKEALEITKTQCD